MKIAFHANEISLRGTGVAMFDYAHYNKKLLGNESIVLHWKGSTANHPLAYEKYEKHFEIFG